jgi:hypothetical protein
MNLKVINKEKNMKIILVKKNYKKTLCWMVSWITIVYALGGDITDRLKV